MQHAITPIHAVDSTMPAPASGCGSCLQRASAAACQVAGAPGGLAPAFSGPHDEVHGLLGALSAALGIADAEPARWLQALHVEPGEVTLTLTGGAQCSRPMLADAAFHALRRLRPDTDIYVNVSNAAGAAATGQ